MPFGVVNAKLKKVQVIKQSHLPFLDKMNNHFSANTQENRSKHKHITNLHRIQAKRTQTTESLQNH